MNHVFFTFSLVFLWLFSANAQENKPQAPRFSKQALGESGLYAYLPPGMIFEHSHSEDGSDIFTGEAEMAGGYTFGVIAVRFLEPMQDLAPEARESVLISYMEFLREEVIMATSSVGFGKGHRLDEVPEAVGVIDYMEDAEGLQYAVKGWITARHLVYYYVYGQDEYPYVSAYQMYVDGLREN